MDYKLVFDLQSSEIRLANYLFLLPGIIIFIIGAITYFFRDYFTAPFRARPMPRRFPFFLVLFGALWMQLSALSLYTQYLSMQRAITTGKVMWAEGKVAHFEPNGYSNQMERFCISDTDTCFTYSDYVITPGFNQTHLQGGPIENGLPVRIMYKENTILKLEVAKSGIAYAQRSKDTVPAEATLSPAR